MSWLTPSSPAARSGHFASCIGVSRRGCFNWSFGSSAVPAGRRGYRQTSGSTLSARFRDFGGRPHSRRGSRDRHQPTRSFWRRKARASRSIADDSVVVRRADGDRLDLDVAIARLPDGYRAVLVLHDVEGLTHEEIGARLGIAIGTSKSQLFAARRAMRAHLAPSEEPAVIEGEPPCEPCLKTT